MILVDDRIGQGALIKSLGSMGVPVVIQRLNFGDIAFDINGQDDVPVPVGFELKKVGDLLQCITSKRFAGYQLPGLCNTYRVRYLIVEGPKRKGPDGLLEVPVGRSWAPHMSNMRYMDVMSWLAGVEMRAKVQVIHTQDSDDTAQHIFSRFSNGSKSDGDHNSFKVFYEPEELSSGVSFSPITRRRRIAALLPGVGWEKSAGACEVFPSIKALVNSTAEEWTHVQYGRQPSNGRKRPNISLITAKKIIKALDE